MTGARHPVIVFDAQCVLRDRDAILAIWAGLDWPWRALAAFGAAQRGLWDPVYRWIARNRYRLFGRHDRCWVPSPADTDRSR